MGRLRPRIITAFGTTRVVGRQPNASAAFTPGEIPGTHFQRQGTWFCRKEPRKKSPVTPRGIDPGTIRLVAQRLNHYATPGPCQILMKLEFLQIFYKYWNIKFHENPFTRADFFHADTDMTKLMIASCNFLNKSQNWWQIVLLHSSVTCYCKNEGGGELSNH